MRTFAVIFLLLSQFVIVQAHGQEVVPRINLAGRGLVSLNGEFTKDIDGDTDSSYRVDFSDSSLLIDLRQKLYGDTRGGFVIGLTFPDATESDREVFYHQVNAYLKNQWMDLRLGRSRLRNFLVGFPTMRDDDLVDFAFVNNAFFDSEDAEDQLFGDVVNLDIYQFNSRLVLSGHAEHLKESPEPPIRLEDEFELNSVGGSIVYRLPPPLIFEGIIRQTGIAINSQNVDLPGEEWVHVLSGGLALNIIPNPINHLEFRAQAIYNFGVDGAGIGSIRARGREESFTGVGSLRFLRSPGTLPKWQAALTFAYKRFLDIHKHQYSGIANFFYRLGANFDLGLQYQESHWAHDLARSGTRVERSINLALIFNSDLVFNNYFDERDSVLSLEHGYIP